MMRLTTAAILGSALLAQSARSAETITYTYDAHGRIIQVVRTGAVNNNVTYTYEHDKADNRRKVIVTNSPNPPPP
jgi:YD repeat-containing protein